MGFCHLGRLVAAFGSTRRKRQLDAKETAKVEEGNVAAMEAVEDLLTKAGDKAAAAGMTKVPPLCCFYTSGACCIAGAGS